MSDAQKPAFPIWNEQTAYCDPGLTKREYFAAMAMQGFIASYAGSSADPLHNHVAEKSVKYANALLAELAKPQND